MKNRLFKVGIWGLAVSSTVYAQSDTGRITGLVTDSTGAVIQRAVIKV